MPEDRDLYLQQSSEETTLVLRGATLTPREQDIAALVFSGYSSKQAGKLLGVSPKTVDVHIRAVLLKVGLDTRADILTCCWQEGSVQDFQHRARNVLLRHTIMRALALACTLAKNLPPTLCYILSPQEAGYKLMDLYLRAAGVRVRHETRVIDFCNDETEVPDILLWNLSHFTSESLLPPAKKVIRILNKNQIKTEGTQGIELPWQDSPCYAEGLAGLMAHVYPQQNWLALMHESDAYHILKECGQEPQRQSALESSSDEIAKIFLQDPAKTLPELPRYRWKASVARASLMLGSVCLGAASVVLCAKLLAFMANDSRMPSLWNVPRQDGVFVGRQDDLKKINACLENPSHKTQSGELVLSACVGLGGVGKTQLILNYVKRKKHPLTLWLPAESPDKLVEGYRHLAHHLSGYGRPLNAVEDPVMYVKEWLEKHPGWLLVLDNAVKYIDIAPFLPLAGGHVVVTSRQKNWPSQFRLIALETMRKDEALGVLTQVSGLAGEERAKQSLAELVGYLPLALAQAANYVAANRLNFTTYLQLYQRHTLQVFQQASLDLLNDGSLPVMVTWDITLKHIFEETQKKKHPPLALELLMVCAYLSPDCISRATLLRWLKQEHPDMPAIEVALHSHLGLVLGRSMLQTQGNNLVIHRLVQRVLRHKLYEALAAGTKLYGLMDSAWMKRLLCFLIHDKDFKASRGYAFYFGPDGVDTLGLSDVEMICFLQWITASVFWCQERYDDFKHMVDSLQAYINQHADAPLAPYVKGKIAAMYGGYWSQQGDRAREVFHFTRAQSLYKKVDFSKFPEPKRQALASRLLFDQAFLCYALYRHHTTPTTLTPQAKADIQQNIARLEESFRQYQKKGEMAWGSLEIACRLKNLLGRSAEVLKDLKPYTAAIPTLFVDRRKLFMYLTLAAAHVHEGNFETAASLCSQAAELTQSMGLQRTLRAIKEIEGKLRDPYQRTSVHQCDFFEGT